MRKWTRRIAAAVWLLMLVPLVGALFQLNIEKLSEEKQWDRWLLEHWEPVMSALSSILASKSFWLAFGLVTGIAATLWVQEILKYYPIARIFGVAGLNTIYNEDRGAEYVSEVRDELISKFWNWKGDRLLMRPEYEAFKVRVYPELAKWLGVTYARRWRHIGDLGPHFKEHYKIVDPDKIDEQIKSVVKDINTVRSMMERDLHMFDDLLDKYNDSRLFQRDRGKKS